MTARCFGIRSLKPSSDELEERKRQELRCETPHDSWTTQPWGPSNWPLALSSPERAILELLDELPRHESFHQADVLMEGLANLSPRTAAKTA